MSKLKLLGSLVVAILLFGCAHHPYELRMVPVSAANWDAIKYDPSTGQSWYVKKGEWRKIEDDEVIPKSSYNIYMVPLEGDWGAIRLDVKSGDAWRAQKGRWVRIANREDQ